MREQVYQRWLADLPRHVRETPMGRALELRLYVYPDQKGKGYVQCLGGPATEDATQPVTNADQAAEAVRLAWKAMIEGGENA